MTYTIASAEDFAVTPEEVQLPSQRGTDKAVLLKRPDLIALVTGKGDIPDVLTGLIMQSVEGGGGQREFAITRESLPEIMSAMNAVCKATFFEPQVWDNDEPGEGCMPLAWLTFDDKAFVFAWALGGEYEGAKSFRDEPGAGVDTVPASNGTAPESKRKAKAGT